MHVKDSSVYVYHMYSIAFILSLKILILPTEMCSLSVFVTLLSKNNNKTQFFKNQFTVKSQSKVRLERIGQLVFSPEEMLRGLAQKTAGWVKGIWLSSGPRNIWSLQFYILIHTQQVQVCNSFINDQFFINLNFRECVYIKDIKGMYS